MISANGGLPAHRYTPQVTPRWPRGSEPASQAGFFSSFLLQCKVAPTFLYITAVSVSHSYQLLGHLHPNTSVPALYAHFLEAWQSAQSVSSS